MKALKLFRALSMAGGLACFMISCLPEGDGGYDWPMIVVLVFFQMFVEVINSFRQQSDLNFGRTGVAFVRCVFYDNFFLFHFALSSYGII